MTKEIKEFIEAFKIAVGNMDLSTLEPMSNFMFHPLFPEQWIYKWENVIRISNELNIPIKELTKYISGPGHIRSQFFFMLLDLKCSKTKKEKRVKIANFFNELLRNKAVEDPYGWKSNIAHTKEEIREILNKTKFNKGTEEISRFLGRLYSAAYHLTNGLYTDFYTDFGVECQGEYKLYNNHILVIRHFYDLNPKELWPNLNSPCKKLTIYTVYKNIRFKTDSISVHSVFEGDPIKNLVAWAVKVNGKYKSIKELKPLKEKLELKSVEQWKRLTSLNHEDLKVKGLFMRGYIFKDFFERLNLDWKPSKEMIEAVKHKPFTKEDYWQVPEINKDQHWNKIYDPYIDFYPG